MMNTTEKPKPCPFCGNAGVKVWQLPRHAVEEGCGRWIVKCVDGCSVNIDGYISREAALKAWNQRPQIEKPTRTPLIICGNCMECGDDVLCESNAAFDHAVCITCGAIHYTTVTTDGGYLAVNRKPDGPYAPEEVMCFIQAAADTVTEEFMW